MRVSPVNPSESYTWLLNRHYAKRIPPISHAFGLYEGSVVSGVITFGVPVSSTLRGGVAGEGYVKDVLELNRLCINSANKGAASCLVSNSISQLPKGKIIVSYADTSMGHVGYVYQASNFIYTGLSAKRSDWKIRGHEHLHSATVADMSRGHENRAEYMRERFGDDFYLEDRPRKHRYIFFHGSKTYKKAARKALLYKVMPYPKGRTQRYNDAGYTEQQLVLFASSPSGGNEITKQKEKNNAK